MNDNIKTTALTVYEPKKSKFSLAVLRFFAFSNKRMNNAYVQLSKSLCVFFCIYFVFLFFGVCAAYYDCAGVFLVNGLAVSFDFSKCFLIFLIICGLSSWTIFGKFISVILVTIFGLINGFLGIPRAFSTLGGKFNFLSFFNLLLISFLVLAFASIVFENSNLSYSSPREMLRPKRLFVHLFLTGILIILIYLIFLNLYNF